MRDRHKQLIHPARLPTFLWLKSAACIPTQRQLSPPPTSFCPLTSKSFVLFQKYFTEVLFDRVGCDQARPRSS
ncbi:uncharacterized protein Bfra_001104 [Botrytis fragariae]|uniref:Uncharacterized protein n=1 Tax=Botrytis fragariae TaxID=1964551 RepID=A0A8H6B3W0_9HELO|nr:uncharacterized protein Bfra_001104 [Botrytis fragariae]KAF5878931.1 hypothetical protein Bfra_001104 [Botrytis fragariae]